MIGNLIWTFIVLWLVHLALYWYAMKLLWVRPIHSLWFATITAFPSSIVATSGAEQYLVDHGLNIPFVLVPIILCFGCGIAFEMLLWWRNNRKPNPSWHDYIPLGMTWRLLIGPIIWVSHLAPINTMFIIVFDAIGFLVSLNSHFKEKAADRERQRFDTRNDAT